MGNFIHNYIPRISQREDNLFLEEYYSGTDTKVYLNNDSEQQKEISYIAYSVSEQLKPIYGYASRTWDDVAIGNRIVTGTFKVAIKNPIEENTDLDSIIAIQRGTSDEGTVKEIEDLNDEYQEALENTEWINEENKSSTEETKKEVQYNAEVQDYQTKLKSLGYNIPVANGYMDSITNAMILQFCSDNGLMPNNSFSTDIKNKIDEEINKKNMAPKALNAAAIVRKGPDAGYGVIATLESGTLVFVLGSSGKYTLIQSVKGNIKGYVLNILVL